MLNMRQNTGTLAKKAVIIRTTEGNFVAEVSLKTNRICKILGSFQFYSDRKPFFNDAKLFSIRIGERYAVYRHIDPRIAAQILTSYNSSKDAGNSPQKNFFGKHI